jgi:hypothetical protein
MMSQAERHHGKCAYPRWRLPYHGLAMFSWVVAAASTCLAGWDLTPPADPNRNWGVGISQSGSYDDNFNATESNRQSGFRYNSDLVFRANIPLERMFIGLNYDYGVTYPQDVNLGGFNQSHNARFAANFTVSPRLSIDLNGNYVNSLQPELVQGPAGAPVTIVQAGTYVYEIVGCSMSYALTPRWTLQAGGSWDSWKYDNAAIATNSDHQDYQVTLSAFYGLNERTGIGLNYQYSQNIFSNPGTNNAANALSHTMYLSLVKRFNPRLSLQFNSGYTIRESEDGSVNTSPSEYASLVYNYGPVSTASLILGYSLSQASVGNSRLFSSSQNTSFALSLNHRLSARLTAMIDASYVFSTFSMPLQSTMISGEQQQLVAHLGLSYNLLNWLSVFLSYQHTRLSSNLPGMKYDRNQISLGLNANY